MTGHTDKEKAKRKNKMVKRKIKKIKKIKKAKK